MAQTTGNTFRFSYVRTSADIKVLRVTWVYRADPDPGATRRTLAVTLTLRDAAGNTITPPASEIPTQLDGTSYYAAQGTLSPTGDVMLGGVAHLDLDAIASTLTNPSWELQLVLARSGAAVTFEWLHAEELPRSIVKDSDTYGALVGPMNPGSPVLAGSTTTKDYERIAKTIEGARVVNRTYLNVAWPADITATIPSTTSATYAPFATLIETAGVPVPWRVRPRVVYKPSSAVGEPARVRFLCYVAGGGTAYIRVKTGATGSPYATTAITGFTWAWSDWLTIELPTDGTGGTASVTFEGKTSAGTLYLAGIHMEEYQT